MSPTQDDINAGSEVLSGVIEREVLVSPAQSIARPGGNRSMRWASLTRRAGSTSQWVLELKLTWRHIFVLLTCIEAH